MGFRNLAYRSIGSSRVQQKAQRHGVSAHPAHARNEENSDDVAGTRAIVCEYAEVALTDQTLGLRFWRHTLWACPLSCTTRAPFRLIA
eukprot:scaffold226412_cov26-Tisochrysis_lutea.AAC.1